MATGRPPSFTPDLQASVCASVRAGLYIEQAAALASVHHDTILEWLRRGRRELRRRASFDARWIDRERTKGRKIRTEAREAFAEDAKTRRREQKYVDFTGSFEKAKAEGEALMIQVINAAARGGVVESVTTRETPSGERITVEKRTPADWKAAAWKLSRRHAQRWGDEPSARPQDEEAASVETTQTTTTPEDYAAKMAERIAALGKEPT